MERIVPRRVNFSAALGANFQLTSWLFRYFTEYKCLFGLRRLDDAVKMNYLSSLFSDEKRESELRPFALTGDFFPEIVVRMDVGRRWYDEQGVLNIGLMILRFEIKHWQTGGIMFREMRRAKQQVSEEDCKTVLRTAKRAVLSVIGDDGYPYGVPIDFLFDEENGTIYFHCAKAGHKIDAIKRCPKVCFTTWNEGFRKPGDWPWNVTSVIAMGIAELVDDTAVTAEKALKLALKYYPTAEAARAEVDKAVSRVQLVAIHVQHMTGKLVKES